MRSITTLQQSKGISVEGTLFDLAAYEKPSKPIHDYDLDNCGTDDDPLEAYKQQCRKSSLTSPAPTGEETSKTGNSIISNSAAASADSATQSTDGFAIESVPQTTATSTSMPLPSTPPASPTCESTTTSAPISPSVENLTLSPVDSLAPEPARREVELDLTTRNQVSGEKGCEFSAKSAPGTSSGSNLWELSNEDYANFLEPAEWQDILAESSELLLPSLGLVTSAREFSLSVPTLMTGTGSQRNAGQTKCEQKLKKLGIVPPGSQLSPEGMAALMGFPLDWFAAIAPVRYPLLCTVSPTDSPNATMFGGLPVGASPQPKPELPLPSPSGLENDSVRIGALKLSGVEALTLTESSTDRGSGRRSVCRSCGEPISWGKTAAGKNCPFNLDGTSHFTTCPDANRWSRKAQPDDSISDSVPTLSESSDFPSRLAISFGKTQDRLHQKTVTRRDWKPSRAKTFANYYSNGFSFPALDKDRRFGGTEIGTLKLTEAPYQERLADMPSSDVAAEGYPELTKQEFIDRFFDGDGDRVVWVVRFEFVPCEVTVATAWGEFYGSENGRIWESKSHGQRWNWKNMEVLELEQLGTERLIIPYGRLPRYPDGSRPVVPAGMEVKFARPFWVEEEELQPIEVEMTSKSIDTVLAIDSEPEQSPACSLGSQGREKLRSLADSLSEEGLRALVRRLSESLGDDSVEKVDRVLDESSFEEKTADSSQEPQKSVSDDSITRMAVTDTRSRSFTACGDEPTSSVSAESSRSPDEPLEQGVEPVLSPSSVGVYAPGGEARGGHEYFRLTWWDKGRSRSKHIRGGNTSKPSAISRVRKIIDAIAARWSFFDVLALC